MQAMDRAHRLGQKKVVNVHRLIMRGTLEEKVMSLQRFKVSVANAVINAENSSLKTMNTDQLLDLFASAEVTRKVYDYDIYGNDIFIRLNWAFLFQSSILEFLGDQFNLNLRYREVAYQSGQVRMWTQN